MYHETVLTEEINGTYNNDFQKNYIGIGGTCTITTETEKVDLIEATINMVTKTITGKLASDIEIGFRPWEADDYTIKFEDIHELIFEGFYINENNRKTVLKLANSNCFKLTKIPRRN
ncbi:hypothetical protein [Methanobrevibacter sp.]|uniref:hypothetical protein n=1 Tax=Methanobrevibacter sp. TaxID=66852 RepID=UPI003866FC46